TTSLLGVDGFASPLTEGKRIEVRGSGHTITRCSTLILPSPLQRERRPLIHSGCLVIRHSDFVIANISVGSVRQGPARREACDECARPVRPVRSASYNRVRCLGDCIHKARDRLPVYE